MASNRMVLSSPFHRQEQDRRWGSQPCLELGRGGARACSHALVPQCSAEACESLFQWISGCSTGTNGSFQNATHFSPVWMSALSHHQFLQPSAPPPRRTSWWLIWGFLRWSASVWQEGERISFSFPIRQKNNC